MVLKVEEVILRGYSLCRGIAIGKSFFLSRDDFAISEQRISPAQAQHEIERYHEAILRSQQDIKRLQKQLEIESLQETIPLLETQLQILQDPSMTAEIEKEIRKSKRNVEYAFQKVVLKYKERFQALNDPFFLERFSDLQDVSRRVFGYLYESGNVSLGDVPPNSIVCAQELTASDVASAHISRVSAFVTEKGGPTTHAAIVAKAKGIPFISNIDLNFLKEYGEHLLIVDGLMGKLILYPSQEKLAEYEQLKIHLQHQEKALEQVVQWPAQTFDGYSIRLYANLDMIHEIDLIHKLGGQGIGLFRSEYIFLSKDEIPGEEEQFRIYSHIVERMRNLPVVIRTFDLGGDKTPQSLSAGQNSFLSCRATRFLLKEQKLFKEQLRAILRASVYGNVSILFPMISTLPELREVKRMVQEVRQELNLFHPIRMGCMIEVPSAALIIDHFAKECDFFSIGTNDLVQYALAVDRSDQTSSEFYKPTDPSILRLIRLITREANKQRIPVSVCGEMASYPWFTALLLGLGVQELSVAPRDLPRIKNTIRCTSIVDAIQLAERALELATAQEVLDLLMNDYRQNVPPDFWYDRSPVA